MAPKKGEAEVVEVAEELPIVRSGHPIFNFVVRDEFGAEVPMLNHEGKVLLIVNVASLGTLTAANYTELTELYSKHKGPDFEILAFPCNQFGAKEPNDMDTIKEFVTTKFHVEFPVLGKVNVNGPHASPLWQYLKAQKGGGILGDNIKWNFAKFLVDKFGNVVGRYGPTTPPSKIEKDIQSYMSAKVERAAPPVEEVAQEEDPKATKKK